MAAADEIAVDEPGRVRAWKVELLAQMGYADADACELAEADVDVHLVERLLAVGCNLATAARIAR